MFDSANACTRKIAKQHTSEYLSSNLSTKDLTIVVDSQLRNENENIPKKVSQDASSVSSHRNFREENKIFICDICKVGFKTDIGLSVHHYNNCGENFYETHQDDSPRVVPDRSLAVIKRIKNGSRSSVIVQKSEIPIYKKKQSITCIVNTAFEKNAYLNTQLYTKNKNLCETNRYKSAKVAITSKPVVGIETVKKKLLQKESIVQKTKKMPKKKARVPSEEKYCCYICKLKFARKIDLILHFSMHPGKKPFHCDICQKGFNFMRSYTKHYSQHQKPFMCDICKKSFDEKAQLDAHCTTHLAKKIHVCEICKKVYSTKYNLIVHSKYHKGEKQLVHELPEKTIIKSETSEHEQQHFCDICKESFSSSKKLKLHTSKIHIKCVKEHVCDLCGKVFKNLTCLTRHIAKKECVCVVCTKAFKSKYDLITHYRTHTGEKPFVCDICLKAFSDYSSLRKHLRIHTGEKPYVCDMCQKAFSQKGHLSEHYNVHAGEKPFSCAICSTTFTLRKSLLRHGNKFHKGCLLICDMCSMSFTSEEDLSAHLNTHIQQST